MNKIPRGLRVLVMMAVLGGLIWKLAQGILLYPSIGIAIIITGAMIYFTYRTPKVKKPQEQEREEEAETSDELSEAGLENDREVFTGAKDSTLATSDSMLDFIKSNSGRPASWPAETLSRESKPVIPEETFVEASEQAPRAAEPMISETSQPMPLVAEEQTTLTTEDKNRLMNATWYRCENPYCKYTQFLDIHHITAEKDGGTNKLDNLIVLCPYCHALADKNEIPAETMQEWIKSENRFNGRLDWRYR